MLFASVSFLILFVPIFFFIYFFLPAKYQLGWLLVGNLFFYSWFGLSFTLFFLIIHLINFYLGRLLEKNRVYLKRKRQIFIGILIFQVFIYYISYYHMAWFGSSNFIPLGIGIWFIQSMTYFILVLKDQVKAAKTFFPFLLYQTMFPFVTLGPVLDYPSFLEQLQTRHPTLESLSQGFVRVLLGFIKLVAGSAVMYAIYQAIFTTSAISMLTSWLGILSFLLFAYYLLVGYSDVALGLARMLGMTYPENFHSPMLSTSMHAFSQRFMITIHHFFYQYGLGLIPACAKTGLKFIIYFGSFALLGLWYAPTWRFLIAGILLGSFILLEKVCTPYLEKQSSSIKHLIFLGEFLLLLLVLALPNWSYLSSLIGLSKGWIDQQFFLIWDASKWFFLVGILGFFPIFEKVKHFFQTKSFIWRFSYQFVTLLFFFLCLFLSFELLMRGITIEYPIFGKWGVV